jgi:hypothetical protein
MKTTRAYEVYSLGAATLAAGPHVLRIAVTGPGSAGGWHVTPDELTLTS